MISKSSNLKTLTGTLGGVAEHFNVDYAWLKLSFGLLALIVGIWAVAAYFVLFLIMPDAKKTSNLENNIFAQMARRLVYDLRQIIFRSRYSKLFGFTFLALGAIWVRGQGMSIIPAVLLLVGTILLFDPFSWRKDTPQLVMWQLPTTERPN